MIWFAEAILLSYSSFSKFVLPSLQAFAEERKEEKEEWRKNLILINPLGLIFGIFNIEYMRGVLENLAVGGSFSFFSLSAGDVSFSAIGIAPEIAVFFTGKAPEGLNLAGALGLLFASAKSAEESASVTGFSLPILLRYNWIFGEKEVGFGLSVGGGIQFVSLSALGVTVSGISPAISLSLGVGF